MCESTATFSVPGASCARCVAAITGEVARIDGVSSVEVDLGTKRVTVLGDGFSDTAVRAAIDEAGYEVAA